MPHPTSFRMDTDKTQTLRQKLHGSLEGAVRFGNSTAPARECQIRRTRGARGALRALACSVHTPVNATCFTARHWQSRPIEPAPRNRLRTRTAMPRGHQTARATIESDICGPPTYRVQHGTVRPAAGYGPVVRHRLLAASRTASDLRSCMADGSRSPLAPSRRLR